MVDMLFSGRVHLSAWRFWFTDVIEPRLREKDAARRLLLVGFVVGLACSWITGRRSWRISGHW